MGCRSDRLLGRGRVCAPVCSYAEVTSLTHHLVGSSTDSVSITGQRDRLRRGRDAGSVPGFGYRPGSRERASLVGGR